MVRNIIEIYKTPRPDEQPPSPADVDEPMYK